jgi:hypothetical protein
MSHGRDTIGSMARVNRSISIPEDISAGIDAAAEVAGVTPSAWLVNLARRELKAEEGLAAMDEWFAENGGPATPEEKAYAEDAVRRAKEHNRAFRQGRAEQGQQATQERAELAS